MTSQLVRETFETSRLLEFFNERELTMQLGKAKAMWPVVIIKEKIDNGLDACENAGVPPTIEIKIDKNRFSVMDNGPGIPESTLRRTLNYSVRISDKSFYISPTRGQLGNALKTIYAAPFIIDGEKGVIEIQTQNKKHTIEIKLDRIEQRPKLDMITEEIHTYCKNGTKITTHWPDSASLVGLSHPLDFYISMRTSNTKTMAMRSRSMRKKKSSGRCS